MKDKDRFCWGMLTGCILTLVAVFVIEKVFSPPNGSGVTRPSFSTDAPARFYYTVERQRIMRDEGVYTGKIDGFDGPLTRAAVVKHNQLYNDWCAKEDAKWSSE